VIIIVFLIGSLFLIYKHSNTGSKQNFKNLWIQKSIYRVWEPLQYCLTCILNLPSQGIYFIRNLESLEQQRQALIRQNQLLQFHMEKYDDLKNQVMQLESILKVKPALPKNVQIAQVISYDPSVWNKSCTINRGFDDGVQVGATVLTTNGIVGQVIMVLKHCAKVLMLLDPRAAISGYDTRSEVIGIAVGTGSTQMQFKFVNANESVQIGDKIVSSGLGGIFPRGYPIGTIVQKSRNSNNLTQNILLDPEVNFDELNYVFVLNVN
jgi:rod shape-determining protein MreC